MSFLEGNPLKSIFTGSCPVCQQKSMYKVSNPYKIKSLLEMHENCLHCDTKFKIEPSFFYGAMYVSYGVGIAIGIAAFIIGHFLLQLNLLNSFFFIAIAVFGLLPIILRVSRNIWINLFMKYDKEKAK